MLALLLIAAAASQPAQQAKGQAQALAKDDAVHKALRDCGHDEGPVSLVIGGKSVIVHACSTKGQTKLLVFATLQNGVYAPMCELTVPGLATQLRLAVPARSLLQLVTRVLTPEEERVRELAIVPHDGHCETVAESDVWHPGDDDATLREPAAGLEIGDDAITAWKQVKRLPFKLSLSERRSVTMMMLGTRVDLGTRMVEAVEKEAFEPIPIAHAAIVRGAKSAAIPIVEGELQEHPTLEPGAQLELDFVKPIHVRGVRLRMQKTSGDFTVQASEASIDFGPKMQWSKAHAVFGAGLLVPTEVSRQQDAVGFFQPPIETTKVVVKPSGTKAVSLWEVLVFTDTDGWISFEPSEDFGEHE